MFVVVPDHHGAAARSFLCGSGILPVLAAEFPGTTLIVCVNGPDRADLTELSTQVTDSARATGQALVCVVTGAGGVAEALSAGYRAALALAEPDDLVVRLDTAETPTAALPLLAETVRRGADLAVLDLQYDEDLMPSSSPESLAHRLLLPQITEVAFTSAGAAGLSVAGAHGMCAARAGALRKALPRAEHLLQSAGDLGVRTGWGFDFALLLSAARLGLDFAVLPYAGVEPRQREPQKIAAQVRQIVALSIAAERL